MASGNCEWRSDDLGSARILDLDGGRLRVHVTGDGPAVVLVHGVLVNAEPVAQARAAPATASRA